MQLSSALKVTFPQDAAGSRRARRAAAPVRRLDLSAPGDRAAERTRAPSLRGSRRRARPPARRRAGAEWRIHFHVPLFTAEYDGLGSTQDYVRTILRDRRAHAVHAAFRDRDLHVGRAARRARRSTCSTRLAGSTSGCSITFRSTPECRDPARSLHRHAQDRRPQRRRPDAGAARRLDAGADARGRGEGAVARIKSAFPAVTCSAQADYLTGTLPRQPTASSATAGIRARTPRSGSGSSRTCWCRRRRSGTRRAPPIRPSRARTCSGGSTCIRRRTIRSRRGRCIRPTAARSPTSTPQPSVAARRAAVGARDVSAVRVLGAARRRSDRRGGSPRRPSRSISSSTRR